MLISLFQLKTNTDLKVSFNAINSQIVELSEFSLELLSKTTMLSESTLRSLAILTQSFIGDLKYTIQNTLRNNVEKEVELFLLNNQDKTLNQFEILFKEILINNNQLGNIADIIKDQINYFDFKEFKQKISSYYHTELLKANEFFVTPLLNSIEVVNQTAINQVNQNFIKVGNEIKTKTLKPINEDIEQIMNDAKAIIRKMTELINTNKYK